MAGGEAMIFAMRSGLVALAGRETEALARISLSCATFKALLKRRVREYYQERTKRQTALIQTWQQEVCQEGG